jgi:hypothetical protein
MMQGYIDDHFRHSLFISHGFWFFKEWIMDQWNRNYYISALAGASNGSSLVVMSKGNNKLAV